MTSLVGLDYETFFDTSAGYSLKKLTTEEYIRHPLFEVIGFSLKEDNQPAQWFTGDMQYCYDVLSKVPWHRVAMAGHNNRFDAGILNMRFGLRPRKYLCTMSMAMGLYGLRERVGLGTMAEYLNLSRRKGDEVKHADGLRRLDFPAHQLQQYGRYCVDDTEICVEGLGVMLPQILPTELQLIDWTIRSFVEPQLVLNAEVLREELAAYHVRKNDFLRKAGVPDVTMLRSDDQFAAYLIRLGVDPPTKESPKQKNPDGSAKRVWAFAKQDIAFMDLLLDDDEDVVNLVEARIGAKTSQVQSRLERLIGIASRGPMPTPHVYCGATPTRRWAGDDKVNVQNFPRNKYTKPTDGSKPQVIYSPLRRAITAPPGKRMASADLSQIELRVNAWQSGQTDVLDMLRAGGDVYCDQATELYGRLITKANPLERFVGKTTELQCLSATTLVLTQRGAVPIISVTKDDNLWDGVEWVRSDGPQYMGHKEVVESMGLQATGDHQVLGFSGWRPWERATANTMSRLSASVKAVWSLKGMLYQEALHARSAAGVRAASGRGLLSTTGGADARRAVTVAPKRRLPIPTASWLSRWLASKWVLTTSCAMTVSGFGAGAGLVAQSSGSRSGTWGAHLPEQRNDAGRAAARGNASTQCSGICVKSGGTCAIASQDQPHVWSASTLESRLMRRGWTSLCSLLTRSAFRVGAVLSVGSSLTGLMVRSVIAAATAGGSTLLPALATFDLANVGPRNRFTVVAAGLPLIVHNCSYQCGADKFLHSLKVAAKRDGFQLQDDSRMFAQNVINTYRRKRSKIKAFWWLADSQLQSVAYGMTGAIGPYPVKDFKIWLPNGSHLYYPDLAYKEKIKEGEQGCEWVYQRVKNGRKVWRTLYGGKLCIAKGTAVLTDRGWVPIENVRCADLVHDGVEFVPHGGKVFKSVQACVSVDGVGMTHDHEVLTDNGWQAASQGPEPYRPDLRDVAGPAPSWVRWEEAELGVPVPVWPANSETRSGRHEGVEARRDAQLRVPYEEAAVAPQNARHVAPPRVLGVAVHAGPLPTAFASGMEELRRAWDYCMQALGEVREFLGRHGSHVPQGVDARAGQQQSRVHTPKLPLGDAQGAGVEQAQQHRAGSGFDVGSDWDQPIDVAIQGGPRVANGAATRATYDIVNCGPRSRFVVAGREGPFIVHNCENITQAVARLFVSDALLRLETIKTADGHRVFDVVFMVHDELVVLFDETLDENWVRDCLTWAMTTNPAWAPDLPLECEVNFGQHYGECK